MQYFSQDGQDKFIVKLFKGKAEGVFLDIGAYDGMIFSNTLYLEKNLGWKGICIEPNPLVFEQLQNNRKCVCLNCCVGQEMGIHKFLSVSGHATMLSGLIDMFDEKHLSRINDEIEKYGGEKKTLDVDVLPLKNILDKYGFSVIDYCNIDVEGGEISVLKSIDFSKTLIKVFTIENNLISKIGGDEDYELKSKRYGLIFRYQVKKALNYMSVLKSNVMVKIR
jgi:FkbM family methyltransferase